ncbi:MAG TPA: hypothetical protein VM012_09085 [Flavitalea sp.]|nr:hypothetical protein [Flavitalea sp.]
MRRILFFSILLSVSTLHAQDLTGIWRGHFRSSNSRLIELLGEEDRYKFEVQLNQHLKAFEGVTYSYKTTVFYGKASATGAINTKTKKVLLEELKIVEVRMAGGGDACIMTCFLQYTKSGNEEFLEGTYTSMNIRDSTNCGKGTIFLRKVETSDFYKEPFLVKREKEKSSRTKTPVDGTTAKTNAPTGGTIKKPGADTSKTVLAKKPPVTAKKTVTPPKKNTDIVTTQKKNNSSATDPKIATAKVDSLNKTVKVQAPVLITPKVLRTRENELVKTITTEEKEITINLYDNGTIDNDTVSVYLDKKLVVNNQRLTDKPIQVKFNLDDSNSYHELVMVAENLGEIPPNTSLMVVKAGSKEYEVRITSTEQKNAVVIFKYEKGK